MKLRRGGCDDQLMIGVHVFFRVRDLKCGLSPPLGFVGILQGNLGMAADCKPRVIWEYIILTDCHIVSIDYSLIQWHRNILIPFHALQFNWAAMLFDDDRDVTTITDTHAPLR